MTTLCSAFVATKPRRGYPVPGMHPGSATVGPFAVVTARRIGAGLNWG